MVVATEQTRLDTASLIQQIPTLGFLIAFSYKVKTVQSREEELDSIRQSSISLQV